MLYDFNGQYKKNCWNEYQPSDLSEDGFEESFLDSTSDTWLLDACEIYKNKLNYTIYYSSFTWYSV